MSNLNTHSLDLDKSSTDYAYISNAAQVGLDLEGPFTIESWIKLRTGTSDDQFTVCAKYDTNQISYHFFYENVGTAMLVCVISTDGTSLRTAQYAHTLSLNTWYHIAVTWDRTNDDVYFFVDGSCINTGSPQAFSTTSVIFDGTAEFCIGRKSVTPFHWMDGLLDEVRVWNVVRTPTEIADNYDKRLDVTEHPIDQDLVGYWLFDNDLTDSSYDPDNDLTNSGCSYNTDVPFYGESPGLIRGIVPEDPPGGVGLL